MIDAKEAAAKLKAVIKSGGGVAAFCRGKGIYNQRGNVENMQTGAIPISPTIAQAIGLARVQIQFYLEPGESIPEEFQRFVKNRDITNAGRRPKKT